MANVFYSCQITILYISGLLRTCLGNPDTIQDYVSVDAVGRMMILATLKKAKAR